MHNVGKKIIEKTPDCDPDVDPQKDHMTTKIDPNNMNTIKKEVSTFLKKFFPKSKVLSCSKGLKIEGYDFTLKDSGVFELIIQKWPKECDSVANTVKHAKCIWYFEKFKKQFKRHFQKKYVILNLCENFSIYDDGEGCTVTLVNKKYGKHHAPSRTKRI